MAADSREPEQPSELPKGVVLGKDGKPDFLTWTRMTKSSLKSGTGAAVAAAAAAAASASSQQADDCPPDVEALGRSTWTLLHSIAATYPKRPSAAEQSDLKNFMATFSRLYPCWTCAKDFQRYMEREHIKVGNRDEFGQWLCEAHNAVNKKIGKETFDCSRWEERWRTGWKDGRCD
ncbi:ERV/ALR sulfhydryl oxidase domain-containing protein [Xylariaceae sp. FL0662B]|nr:ERV/ALR sulfhydryl oxidase domain-containing protein [Xylariaceae sp. FL0662B]